MTPKEVKAQHPGYQIKKTASKSNGYSLIIAYSGAHTQASVDILDDVHVYLNDEYVGHWDHMCKPPKPLLAVWNQGTNKFIYIGLNLKLKDKNFKKDEGNVATIVNQGEWIEIDRQFDYNDYTIHFLADNMTEFVRNFKKRSYKWRGMYELCEKGMNPITHTANAKYCCFSTERRWYASNQGIYHYDKGVLIPEIPASFHRSQGVLEMTIYSNGNTYGVSNPKIILNDKEVQAGHVDINNVSKQIVPLIFKER